MRFRYIDLINAYLYDADTRGTYQTCCGNQITLSPTDH